MSDQSGETYEVVVTRWPWYHSQMLWVGVGLLLLGLLLMLIGSEDGLGLFGSGLLFFGIVITPAAILRLLFRR